MSQLLAIKIDVMKINKDRLYKGQKGTYLDLMVEIKDEPDKYDNDVAAWEGQTVDERKEKKDRNFLGNGKVVWSGESKAKEAETDTSDDLPFN